MAPADEVGGEKLDFCPMLQLACKEMCKCQLGITSFDNSQKTSQTFALLVFGVVLVLGFYLPSVRCDMSEGLSRNVHR